VLFRRGKKKKGGALKFRQKSAVFEEKKASLLIGRSPHADKGKEGGEEEKSREELTSYY